MAAAVDIASPEISPREQEKMDIAEEGNLFSPGNDVEVDAVPLSSKVPVDVKYSPVTDIP